MSAEVRPFPRPEEGSLTALFANLERAVAETTPEVVPALLVQLAALQSALAARLVSMADDGQPEASPEDQLLTAEKAAKRLGLSKDALYRKRWPFEVRPTPGTRRFSARGIERYIRQRQGR